MRNRLEQTFDIIVVGAGHAGIEAAAASARLNCKTLLLAMNLDSIGFLACNPSIGGNSKGHLVKEVDALGGLIGLEADKALIQLRTLNTGKGAAVQSPRAQIDKNLYHRNIKKTIENYPNITLRQGEAVKLLMKSGVIRGIETSLGARYYAPKIVLCCGVYLSSEIITGTTVQKKGPSGFARAEKLSASIKKAGHVLRRFKTGTPARIDAKSIDFSKLEIQSGEGIAPFSYMTDEPINYDLSPCYLGYTNQKTHGIIRENLHRSPLYAGIIKGTGARYCPSIEDKIVRFADKKRHQVFLEPEGLDTCETYLQGISTSLPQDVQLKIINSVAGLERAEVMRDAYAIEYDCIDSTTLYSTLESKLVKGLHFAGQINGTSGYEEAAAQGLIAGANAALSLQKKPPLTVRRDEAYAGVLIDDLVIKGTNEPYRMMTSRAEYRLTLRHDNADLRLSQKAYDVGLISEERYARYKKRLKDIEEVNSRIYATAPLPEENALLESIGETPLLSPIKLSEFFKRPGITAAGVKKYMTVFKDSPLPALSEVIITHQYGGYLDRQTRQISEALRLENSAIPADTDYSALKGLRIEAAQKLSVARPATLGQASRISGVNPADITVLMIYLKRGEGTKCP